MSALTEALVAPPKPQPKPVTLDDIIRAVDGYKRGMAALDQLTKPFFEHLSEAERLFAQSATGKVLAVLTGQRAAVEEPGGDK